MSLKRVHAKTPPDAEAAAAAPEPEPADRVFTQLFAALEGALVSGAKLNRLPPDLAHLDDLAHHLNLAPAPAPDAPDAHGAHARYGDGAPPPCSYLPLPPLVPPLPL